MCITFPEITIAFAWRFHTKDKIKENTIKTADGNPER